MTNLTKAQRERLVMLTEECAEIIHAASKILRHGYESYNPDAQVKISNRRQLEKECVDLRAVFYLMEDGGDIDSGSTDDVIKASERKLRYAHHQSPKQEGTH